MTAMHEVKLAALDGANLLGFMAALGTVRLINLQCPASLKWIGDGSAWRPVVVSDLPQEKIIPAIFLASDSLLDRHKQGIIQKNQTRVCRLQSFDLKLQNSLSSATTKKDKAPIEKRRNAVAKYIKKLKGLIAQQRSYSWLSEFEDLKLPPETFRDFACRSESCSSAQSRAWADFAAAFASEAIFEKQKNTVSYTSFCALGGGQSRFIKALNNLTLEMVEEDINEALFSGWQYNKKCSSLRWDGIEHRKYALRAGDPAPDQEYKVPGANRLAFESLPLFPCMPVGARLQTTGFSEFNKRGIQKTQGDREKKELSISWPIWSDPLSIDEIRSLLASPLLQTESPDRNKLASLGVQQLFRAQRFRAEKYLNFSPSRALL